MTTKNNKASVIDRLFDWVYKIAGFKTLLLFTLIFAGFIFIFQYLARGISEPTVVWYGLTKYSAQDVYGHIERIGSQGILSLQMATIFDILFTFTWPILYAIALIMSLRVIFPRKRTLQKWVLVLPLLGFILDQAQNIAIEILLGMYPARMDWLAELSTYLTVALWSVINVANVLIVLGFVIALVIFLRNKFRHVK